MTPARPVITVELVHKYFGRLEANLQSIDRSCLYNHDENNVADDPESKKVICSCGLKTVKRKIEHTKSRVSCSAAMQQDNTCVQWWSKSLQLLLVG